MTRSPQLPRFLALIISLVPVVGLAQQGPAPTSPPPGYVPVQSYGAPPAPPRYTAGPPVHRFELIGLVGYHVASDINFTSGHAAIDGSVSYGASLRFAQAPGAYAELLWVYVPTNIHAVSTFLNNGIADASLNIHYFQLGGTKGFRSGRLEPYLGATMGASLFSAGTLRSSTGNLQYGGSDVWRFGFTLGGGLKIWLADAVALQLDARMLAPVWFSSGALYVGPGGGAFAVSGGIPTVEGNFTGGIVIAP